jgi:hypothetical protein
MPEDSNLFNKTVANLLDARFPAPKTETVRSYETSVTIYNTTRR